MNFIFTDEEKQVINNSFLHLANNLAKEDPARALRIVSIVEKVNTTERIVKLNRKQAEVILYFCGKSTGEMKVLTLPAYEKRVKDGKLTEEEAKIYIDKIESKIELITNLGRKITQKLIQKKRDRK